MGSPLRPVKVSALLPNVKLTRFPSPGVGVAIPLSSVERTLDNMVGDKTTQTKIKNLDHTAKKNGVGLKGTCGRVVIYISTDIFQ